MTQSPDQTAAAALAALAWILQSPRILKAVTDAAELDAKDAEQAGDMATAAGHRAVIEALLTLHAGILAWQRSGNS